MGPMSFSHTLHVSHVGPIYFPYGFYMNTRCFPDGSHVKSWFNPRSLGCILLMLSVFLCCMPDVGTGF